MLGQRSVENSRYGAKIARIRAGTYQLGDFIIADAKDADTSGGVTITGLRRDSHGRPTVPRTRSEFVDEVRALVADDVLDVLLASASVIETLVEEGAFAASAVLPAFRGNEATDAWVQVRGGRYVTSQPKPYCGADLAMAPARLCLYSATFVNDAAADVATLEAYGAFRKDARAHGILHFLEVFNPNVDAGLQPSEFGAFVNDCILRAMASLTRAERPEFLKIPYNGPAALEELADHDASLVVGILGGGRGTHRDTFELIAQGERFGARVALFGRKINSAEHQTTLVRWMRRVADREVRPAEAVSGYHADLARLGLAPDRPLDIDREITEEVLMAARTPDSAS